MSCPVVTLKNGKVKGRVSPVLQKGLKPVYVYRSIPFAKPPVGNLRFMKPQEADPWVGILDGTVVSKSPMQIRTDLDMMSYMLPWKPVAKEKAGEDCLNVSVYTPETISCKKLPVLVYFYGGDFQLGNEIMFDGSAIASLNDVVVVVPNYRTNVFGFFSLGKGSICPGNAGLFDQHASLKWVRDNIGAFGGDPDNVTICGESSGGVSVNLHVNSPVSRGFFHKAISQSGTAFMEHCCKADLTTARNLLLKELGLEGKSDLETLQALQKVDAETLLKAAEKPKDNQIGYFMAMIDGEFITKSPTETAHDKDFTKVPYIIGCNNTEGFGIMGSLVSADFATGMSEKQLLKSFERFGMMTEEMIDSFKKHYIKDNSDPLRFSKMVGQVLNDSIILVPSERTARVHIGGGAVVYFYLGAFRMRLYHDDKYRGELKKKPDFCQCDHGEDIFMTFGLPFMEAPLTKGAKMSEEERELSRNMMQYFTNFMKTGDPNKGVKIDVEWPKYKSNGKYISFGYPIKIDEKLAEGTYEFWTKTIPKLFQPKK